MNTSDLVTVRQIQGFADGAGGAFAGALADAFAGVLVRLEAVEEVVAEHAGRLPPSRSGDVIERRRIAPPCRTCRSVFADVSQLANHTAYFCAGCGDVLFVHSPAPDKEG